MGFSAFFSFRNFSSGSSVSAMGQSYWKENLISLHVKMAFLTLKLKSTTDTLGTPWNLSEGNYTCGLDLSWKWLSCAEQVTLYTLKGLIWSSDSGHWTLWSEVSLQEKSTYLSSLDQFQSLKKSQHGHFLDSGFSQNENSRSKNDDNCSFWPSKILKIRFQVKSEWMKNSEISTLVKVSKTVDGKK